MPRSKAQSVTSLKSFDTSQKCKFGNSVAVRISATSHSKKQDCFVAKSLVYPEINSDVMYFRMSFKGGEEVC